MFLMLKCDGFPQFVGACYIYMAGWSYPMGIEISSKSCQNTQMDLGCHNQLQKIGPDVYIGLCSSTHK